MGPDSGYGSTTGRVSHASGTGRTAEVTIGPYHVQQRLSDRGGRARFVVQRAGLSSLCQLHLFAPLPPTAHEQLRERLSACSRITHRALAATLEVGEDSGRLYVVREHIQGTSLSDVLLDTPPSYGQAMKWTLAAGEALLLLAGSEVRIARLDPEAVVLDGERVCLVEVGLSLERQGPERHANTLALAKLCAQLLTGAPLQSKSVPRRPKHVPGGLWKIVQRALREPPPLSEFLVALRTAQTGGSTRPTSSLILAASAVALVACCIAAAVVAASSTRTARAASSELDRTLVSLDQARLELEQAEQALAEVRRGIVVPSNPDPRPSTQASPPATNDRMLELHAAILEPRLVGRKLLVRWLRLFPTSPEGLEVRGQYCFMLGDAAQALNDFEAAAAGAPLSPAGSAAYALCLESAGQRENSKAVLTELSALEPAPEAKWAQGILAGSNSPEGRGLMLQAAEEAPNSIALQHTTLGGPTTGPLKDQQALLARCDAAVRAHPGWVNAVYQRSHLIYTIWARQQKQPPDLAMRFLSDLKSARDLSMNSMFWTFDGKSYLELNRPWLALGPLKVAERIVDRKDRAQLTEVLTWSTVAHARTGKTEHALGLLRELERLSPQRSEYVWSSLLEIDPEAAKALREARKRN